MNIYGT